MNTFINKQNFHIWALENPRVINQRPLHSYVIASLMSHVMQNFLGLPRFYNLWWAF